MTELERTQCDCNSQ